MDNQIASSFWTGLWSHLGWTGRWTEHWSGPESVECLGFSDLRRLPRSLQRFFQNSYPRNHTFALHADRLIPSRRLADRVRSLSRHYPAHIESLLDLSASKGYFVFDAAARGATRCLGIDIDPRCIAACRSLAAVHTTPHRVAFEQQTLPGLAADIERHGGPYQTALLVNSYQYLRLGSALAPPAAGSHHELFEMLRRVCRGGLVFHNRLSFADLQGNVRERARREDAREYTPERILAAAEEFFEIESLSGPPLRPIVVLKAR